MAVRVDREGRLMRDYHTAQNVLRADTTKGTQDTVLSERFYLADADFLVGLEGDRGFLGTLAAALRSPVWQLFLGRKAFVPSLPVCEGVVEAELYRDGKLTELRKTYLWRKRSREDKPDEEGPREARRPKPLRFVIEVSYSRGEPRQDVPVSFVSRDRRF